MEIWEVLLAIVMFGVAVGYLYRKFFITGGCTCGSSGGCPAKKMGTVSTIDNSIDCESCHERNKF